MHTSASPEPSGYARTRAWLHEYFDRHAARQWETLTSNAPVPQPAVTETPRPAPRPVVRTEPVPQAPVTAPPPPPKPPEPHLIEVIQGTARTTQSFAQDKTGQ